MRGIELIYAERERQINAEGWTFEHDDQHDDGELAMAAACYAAWPQDTLYGLWPFDAEWDKRKKHDRIRQLTIAGALIAAELDRLLRAREVKP